jgi:hypothetical protein
MDFGGWIIVVLGMRDASTGRSILHIPPCQRLDIIHRILMTQFAVEDIRKDFKLAMLQLVNFKRNLLDV